MNLRPIAVLALVLCAWLSPRSTAATIVTLDSNTTLLDLSVFTPGTTYYAAWQLTGSGSVANTATLSAIVLDGGIGLSRQLTDPVDDSFTLGPDASSVQGVWQNAATLELLVVPLDALSLYTQQFVAGNSFGFRVDLTANQIAGFAPDAFTFQLYDSGLETLLYEVSLDLLPAEEVPEPSTLLLALLGIGFVAAKRLRAGNSASCARR